MEIEGGEETDDDDGGDVDMVGYGSTQDPSSYANVDTFQPWHFSLDFAIDFDTRTTSGTITHILSVLKTDNQSESVVYFDVWDAVEVDSAEWAILDTVGSMTDNMNQIKDTIVLTNFTCAMYQITTPNPNIGNALAVHVPLGLTQGTVFAIRFGYTSLPQSTALDWLRPEQTANRTLPFVYSLCQMNFCRDWAPMMDTPSQKITFDATVVAPNNVVVLMSGNQTNQDAYNETHTITSFEMNLKIPTYQLSMAVGGLERVQLSERLFIWAEPPYLEQAAKEFEDLPAALAFAENYLTPYIWGEYSIIVMPPSFPWGGMEHVNANQVSHTLLAGDKSMLKIAIHEITHSWFGNDVGCKSWNHFWINEGFNVFMERKVLADFYDQEYALIDYFTGNTSMVEEMESWYGLDDKYSSLFPDIGKDDPENSFSDVPYEKGAQFLLYIESLIGPEAMQEFLRDYILEFTQMSVDAFEVEVFYENWVVEKFPENATVIVNMTMWDTWVFVPGVAPVDLGIRTDSITIAVSLADAYVELEGMSSPSNYTEFFGYYAQQKVAFVQHLADLLDDELITQELLAFIDMDLNLTSAINPEVRTEWFALGIKAGYQVVMEPAYNWAGEQGRIAFVRPVFQALADSGECSMAEAWYEDYSGFYNSYVAVRVERILSSCGTASPTTAPATMVPESRSPTKSPPASDIPVPGDNLTTQAPSSASTWVCAIPFMVILTTAWWLNC